MATSKKDEKGPRTATFDYSKLFHEGLTRHRVTSPKIVERLKAFVTAKTKRPPDKFGNEHKLNPPFDGVMECHLDGDVCLLFRDKNDRVDLLALVTHDEIKGPRARKLAKKIK